MAGKVDHRVVDCPKKVLWNRRQSKLKTLANRRHFRLIHLPSSFTCCLQYVSDHSKLIISITIVALCDVTILIIIAIIIIGIAIIYSCLSCGEIHISIIIDMIIIIIIKYHHHDYQLLSFERIVDSVSCLHAERFLMGVDSNLMSATARGDTSQPESLHHHHHQGFTEQAHKR